MNIIDFENGIRQSVTTPALTKEQAETLLRFHNGTKYHLTTPGQAFGVNQTEIFLSISRLLKGQLYWETLRDVWIMANHFHSYKIDMRIAFMVNEPGRESLMEKREREYLKNLPNKIKIYRAMPITEGREGYGLSWTLDKKVADFYRDTYGRSGKAAEKKMKIKQLTIDKSRVIAFFDSRGEKEIIYIHGL